MAVAPGGRRGMGLKPPADGDALGDVVVSSRQVVQALGAGLQVAPHHLWNQASERPRAEQMCFTGLPARRRLMAR